MRELLAVALDAARDAGARYADVRVVLRDTEDLATRNGAVATSELGHSRGVGVRALVDGAWGFAATRSLEREAVAAAARTAAAIARASASTRARPIELAVEPAWKDRWSTPVVRDPFTVPLGEKLDVLFRADAVLRARPEIAVAEATLSFQRSHEWLWTTAGSEIEQVLIRSGAGISATAVGHGDTQTRSWPASFGGQHMAAGFELVLGLDLAGHAAGVRDEAVALLTAPPCPDGVRDVVLGSSQLMLQIHESCGHASELDRALGMEESFAGRSFLTPDLLGHYRYGSPLVNLVADRTLPGGLATRGYDDDAVRTQRFFVVRDGVFCGFSTTRDTARLVGQEFSNGCAQAESWSAVPILRIPNLSLLPGDAGRLDDLLADSDGALYLETNRSWSIDQLRLNFEFGCEAAWEIRGGRRTTLYKNPAYQGTTPRFWGSCDAVCGPEEWTLWGVPNCGKGEPMQTAEMSHGAAPARFRAVRVRAA